MGSFARWAAGIHAALLAGAACFLLVIAGVPRDESTTAEWLEPIERWLPVIAALLVVLAVAVEEGVRGRKVGIVKAALALEAVVLTACVAYAVARLDSFTASRLIGYAILLVITACVVADATRGDEQAARERVTEPRSGGG